MIVVQRFRSVGWVLAVAFAALACYLMSQRVAAERAKLTVINQQIVAAKLDIRKLNTELATRARMTELERWNREVLALSAPGSGQYLHDIAALASLEPLPQATTRLAALPVETGRADRQQLALLDAGLAVKPHGTKQPQ
jgi:hypothetical protein